MLLRTGGQNAPWGDGDFGFLDPSQDAIDPNGPCASLTGVAQDTCLIASSGNRTRCFAQRGVDLEPGQKVGIENAVFNTRFDMYNGTMSKNRGNPIYAPAPQRITGLVSASGGGNDNGNGGDNDNGGGNQCLGNNTELSVDSMAFPPDTCHGDGTCDRFGDGEWDRDAYIATNYGLDPDLAMSSGGKFEGASSRFEYYLKEIADAQPNGRILPESNPDSTTDAQMCSTVEPSDNPNRRVFIAAGIDCDENNIQGSAENVPVEEYYEIFLIRPVGDGTGSSGATNTFDMYVEVIGSAGGDGSGDADDGGIFRSVVELYR
jgi:hypothetical protein